MEEIDLEMIEYFWKEKGDVRRWTDWERVEPILKEKYPGLWYAFNQYYIMEDVIDKILSGDWI